MSIRSATVRVMAAVLGPALALSVAGCGSGGAGGDGTYTFKVADSFPKGHVIAENLPKKYMENVERASDGRIEFEYFPAEQLGKAKDMLDLVKGGAVDIAYIAPQYYTEQMPLGDVAGLPGVYPSSATGAPAYHELVTKKLYSAEIEKHQVFPLFSFVTGEYQVASAKRQVTSTADMRGLRVRTSGGHMEVTAKQLKAVPVSLAAPEMYQAMERGTIDANLISAESLKPYGLDAVVKYLTTNLSLGGFGAFYAMNQAKWDELPEDLQKIMVEQGTKTSIAGGKALTADKEKRLKEFEADGMTLTEVPPAERAKFEQVADDVQRSWTADMAKRGLPGKEILAEMKKLTSKQ